MKTRTWIVIDCKESVNNIMIRMKCAFVLKGYNTWTQFVKQTSKNVSLTQL